MSKSGRLINRNHYRAGGVGFIPCGVNAGGFGFHIVCFFAHKLLLKFDDAKIELMIFL
jgi:hypothetical protein